ETAEVLEKLIRNDSDWRLKYHLGLIWWSRNNTGKAKELFSACGTTPAYAPFYAAKAALFPEEGEMDLKRAIELDKEQWRYARLLTEYYLKQNEKEKALAVVESFYRRHPENYIMGMLYARTLLLNRQYASTDALLTRLDIIPFEGATGGRQLYHEAKLMQAVAAMKKKEYKKALAFIQASGKWPENLGVGRPYPEDIDERLENWLAYLCYLQLGNKTNAEQALKNIIAFVPKRENTVSNYLSVNTLVTAWALEKMNRREEGLRLLDQWIQKDPSNKMAAWCKQVFENQPAAVPPKDILKDEGVRIIEEFIHSTRQ
ncbi:MAG TPA: DUF5107 domain-containing protein, partial [Puia sp.]